MVLEIDGLREIEKTKKAKIKPTPIATPVKHIIGMLEAKYLNPIKITCECKNIFSSNYTNKNTQNIINR